MFEQRVVDHGATLRCLHTRHIRAGGAAAAAAVVVSACGGSPAEVKLPAALVLTAGTFTLDIFPAPAELNPGTPTVCLTVAGGPGTSMAIPVEVQREGSVWVARPPSATLRMMLGDVSLAGYYGPLDGSFTQGGATVTMGSGPLPQRGV